MNDMPNAGDILDEHDPEPPVGTIVQLSDGEKWQRLDEPGEWHWAAEHQNYRVGVWRWRRVTFEGPVTVVAVPDSDDDELAESVARAWHYGNTGEDET